METYPLTNFNYVFTVCVKYLVLWSGAVQAGAVEPPAAPLQGEQVPRGGAPHQPQGIIPLVVDSVGDSVVDPDRDSDPFDI